MTRNRGKPPVRRNRKKKRSKKFEVQEHQGKYNVVLSIANASARITFRKLIRGDSDEAKKEFRRLFSTRPSRMVATSVKVFSLRVFRTETKALLVSSVIPNVMKSTNASPLSVTPTPTNTKITVANGQKSTCIGSL